MLLKTKIFTKTTSLGISNSVSPRSHKNHRLLVKLNKKNILGGPNWSKLHCGCAKGLSEILSHRIGTFYRNIPLHVMDAKFQFLCICYSRLYLEEALRVFGLGPNCAHFGGFWSNNSSKQHQIELKFWPQVALIVVQTLLKAFWKTRLFTETTDRECTQSFSFWSKFDLNLSPEDCRNQK